MAFFCPKCLCPDADNSYLDRYGKNVKEVETLVIKVIKLTLKNGAVALLMKDYNTEFTLITKSQSSHFNDKGS